MQDPTPFVQRQSESALRVRERTREDSLPDGPYHRGATLGLHPGALVPSWLAGEQQGPRRWPS